MLEVVGLQKRYPDRRGDVLAIENLDLTVEPGEFITLLGPSGCGKSTALRCIAGLERPDRGRVVIGSRVVLDRAEGIEVPIERRNFGMVFQAYAIWPHMTVYENVAFPLRVMKKRPSALAIKRQVRDALSMVDMEHLADRPVPHLSGGQQQRVALARALVRKPALLLLDEPLSNLDAKLRAAMRTEITDITKKAGVATIYVTHDQVEALDMSDRIVVMLGGRAVQIGTPASIYGQPACRFVADFVGEANLFAGELVGVDRAGGVMRTEFGLLRAASVVGGLREGDLALFCARPENVEILRSDDQQDQNVIRARVDRVSFLGSRREYLLRTPGEPIRTIQHPNITLRPGDDVALYLPANGSVIIPDVPAEPQFVAHEHTNVSLQPPPNGSLSALPATGKEA